jgi:hypothetical protein
MTASVPELWFDRVARAFAEWFRRGNPGGMGAGSAKHGARNRTPCTGHDLDGVADDMLARLRVACRT